MKNKRVLKVIRMLLIAFVIMVGLGEVTSGAETPFVEEYSASSGKELGRVTFTIGYSPQTIQKYQGRSNAMVQTTPDGVTTFLIYYEGSSPNLTILEIVNELGVETKHNVYLDGTRHSIKFRGYSMDLQDYYMVVISNYDDSYEYEESKPEPQPQPQPQPKPENKPQQPSQKPSNNNSSGSSNSGNQQSNSGQSSSNQTNSSSGSQSSANNSTPTQSSSGNSSDSNVNNDETDTHEESDEVDSSESAETEDDEKEEEEEKEKENNQSIIYNHKYSTNQPYPLRDNEFGWLKEITDKEDKKEVKTEENNSISTTITFIAMAVLAGGAVWYFIKK